MIIAVDGTLASGKGTLSKGLATDLGLPHLDTGLLYRATAKACLDAGVDPEDAEAAAGLAKALKIDDMKPEDLRTAEVGQVASKVAVHPPVREALFQLQRDFAYQRGGAILDGRDIGTVVCPEAHVKLWVDADVETRAARRVAELNAKGDPITQDEMVAQLRERDERDKNRAIAPMKPAEDAHLLDTTHLSIDAARAKARQIVDQVRADLARS
ncbi:MAG: cytidylate kinase [Ponticaulis sp.]|nr:cytidylate kinase [Ponticaulis sp.]